MINRIKLATVLFLAVLALTFVSQARAQEVEKKINVTGTWNLTFQWEGGGPGEAVLTLKQKGTKITGDVQGFKIKGTLKGTKISMKILAGCYPIYAGTASNTKMTNGKMNCTEGDGSGTWSAVKVGKEPEESDPCVASPDVSE